MRVRRRRGQRQRRGKGFSRGWGRKRNCAIAGRDSREGGCERGFSHQGIRAPADQSECERVLAPALARANGVSRRTAGVALPADIDPKAAERHEGAKPE